MQASQTLDGVAVMFDGDHAVANAGLVLPAPSPNILGLEAIIDDRLDLADRPGYYRPGRKCLTLIHSMVADGDWISDAEVLSCGSTAVVLGHRVMVPATLGTFLRSFSFGNVRQLDRASELALTGMGSARRLRIQRAHHRHRQLDLRGLRLREGGGRLRLHPRPRLPPDGSDPAAGAVVVASVLLPRAVAPTAR